MIKAIFFDMDGVLIEAKDWHYEALNKALELFGYTITRYEHLTTFDGLPTKNKLQMLTLEKGLPAELHKFINEMKQLYTMELVHTRCKPQFQHEYALSKLKASGYQIAVASNSIRSTIELMMQKSHLDAYLDLIMSNQDVKKAKPDPEIYNKCISHFKLTPEQCLIVEDNENGLKAARATGAHVMQVKDIHEVTHQNILRSIATAERKA